MDSSTIPRLPGKSHQMRVHCKSTPNINFCVTGPQINSIVTDSEEPAPSLSDWHDHEPNLEFDDSELSQAPQPIIGEGDYPLNAIEFELSPEVDEEVIKTDLKLEADNYEDEFRSMTEVDELTSMQAYEKRKFIDFFGTDKQGQHIFAIFACLLPPKQEINNAAFIKFIIRKMESYVQNDYVLVYFHQGLRDKPSINFLWGAYKELDRSFKKNLKSLFVVHPTMFIKIVWNFFKPFISEKFKSKLVYVNSLKELTTTLGLGGTTQPKLPEQIYQFDERYNAKTSSVGGGATVSDGSSVEDLPKDTQFGTTLKFITMNSPCLNYIPPIVRKCVDHLSISGGNSSGVAACAVLTKIWFVLLFSYRHGGHFQAKWQLRSGKCAEANGEYGSNASDRLQGRGHFRRGGSPQGIPARPTRTTADLRTIR